MTVYKVSLQTLSPVHIGDGNELRQGFDFMVRGNATYRLNEDAILQAKENLVRPDRAGHYPTPGALLSEADYERDGYFRYILRGAARSGKMDARVKSFIKDVYDRPYIPGSSLKGALRTALAWTGWSEVGLPGLPVTPDALAWGTFAGKETLFWLEVEAGHARGEQIRKKIRRRFVQAAAYAEKGRLGLVFVLLGREWVLEAARGAFVDIPLHTAVSLGNWRAVEHLPLTEWGRVEW